MQEVERPRPSCSVYSGIGVTFAPQLEQYLSALLIGCPQSGQRHTGQSRSSRTGVIVRSTRVFQASIASCSAENPNDHGHIMHLPLEQPTIQSMLLDFDRSASHPQNGQGFSPSTTPPPMPYGFFLRNNA